MIKQNIEYTPIQHAGFVVLLVGTALLCALAFLNADSILAVTTNLW